MAYHRTSQSIRTYNIFKAVVTLILILIILVLLLRGCGGATPSPSATATTVAAPTATPKVEKPAVTAPTFSAPQVSMDGMVMLSGTGTPGSTVEVWANGERIGKAIVGSDGKWSFAAPLGAGDYDFTARAVDASGATLAESASLKFTVPKPVIVMMAAPQVNVDGTVTLSGTGTPGSTVEIWANGELVGKTTVGTDGKWSFAAPLGAGDYEFAARVVDASGAKLAESEPLKLTVPEPVKAPTLNAPQVGDDGTLTLSGTGTPGSTVEVWANGKLVGKTTVGADGTWSFAAPLEAGDYDFSARAVDASGKTLAESAPLKFTVPVLVKAPTFDLPTVGDDGTVTLSGTGTPGSKVEIWTGGKRIGEATVGVDGTWSFAAPLEAGDYDFSARAVDASGKTLAESAPLKFTVPARVKAPTLTAPLPGAAITGDTVTLEGTGEPGAEVEILDNGKVVGKAVVQADGTWKFDYKVEPGAHALTVQNAGDAASASTAVNVEVAAAAKPAPATGVCSAGNIPLGVDQGTTYIVARCEYMGLIAQRTGVKLADLIAANPQVTNPNLIYPGQVLNLPPR